MEQEANSGRPKPRSSEKIFADLRELAQSDGALHEISALFYRDWVLTIDIQKGRVADDPEHRWSNTRLNHNELMLLLGLSVQSPSDRIYAVQVTNDAFAARADELLREFHDRLLSDCAPTFEKESKRFIKLPESIGLVAREAIYYGAKSFYVHQFQNFSRHRYRNDLDWLLQNASISIKPIIDISKFIVDRINQQITAVGYLRNKGREFTHGDLTNSLLISKSEVRQKFGNKANAFFEKFSTPAMSANAGFTNPFAFNAVAIAPMVDMGEHIYVPNQYQLFESIYESPFYWMIGDKSYKNTAADHRGEFLERTVAHIFRSVFESDNVHENVTFYDDSKNIAGEIDVLVVYGEFVLVTQAKSKRVTLKSRAGDTEALKTDFEGAIQAPYQQALVCVELIRKGADCITKDGKVITFPSVPRLFPLVILSDLFPASTFLSRAMLERIENVAPIIWDLGNLDCIARLLPTPIEMIFYLKCRSDVFDRALSDSEYNFLGYHIQTKLALPDDVDLIMIERDFATVVDDYMIAADVGVYSKRPLGILERIQIPVISALLAELKNADPRIASVVIDLYDFSSAMLEDMSAQIVAIREEIRTTGKSIKALSIQTESGGLTYVVTQKHDAKAARTAEAIGAKHKYDTKSDRWYVMLDSIDTNNPIDGLLPLVWPWKKDEEEEKSSEQVAKHFNTRLERNRRRMQ
jgi:hypothetical protein